VVATWSTRLCKTVFKIRLETTWQEALLIFHDRPIAEVNRRHGQIILMNGQLGQRMVNGSFRLDQLDNVVGQIRQLFDAHVQKLRGGIVLLS
jgi:transmembrane sensor